MNERTMCLVYTQPVPGREAEYNEWYDTRHLQDMARVPGVLSARRFDPKAPGSVGDEDPRYLAIYEIDGDPEEFVKELRSRFGTDQMPASDALDLSSFTMTFWAQRGDRAKVAQQGA